MCIQNLVKFCPLFLKILSRNEILTSIKGHNSVVNLRKITLYNPNLDLINVNVYTKFDSGFLQKHENDIPGLFQDNSRTFFSFQGLNFIDFQSILDCFLLETAIRKQVALHFLSPEYFHYGIDKYRDYW